MNRRSVNSFSMLHQLMGDDYIHVAGAWFQLDESLLIVNGRQFSNHGSPRPVVLTTKPGPNAIVFTRSTTGGAGIPHDPHDGHPRNACCVDKPGHVVASPMTVAARELNHNTYRCLEPDGSSLYSQLAGHKR